jgi:Cys-rich protein (TIGR01571 family)
MTVPEIHEKLEQLKKRKCKLEKAIDAGYFNAHKRLQDLLPEIQSYLDILKLKGEAEAVYMDCVPEPAGIRGTNWTASWVGGKAVPLAVPVKAEIVDVPVSQSSRRETAVQNVTAPSLSERWESSQKETAVQHVTNPSASEWWAGQWLTSFKHSIVSIIVLLIFAFLYDRVRLKTAWEQQKPHDSGDEGFHHGLFGCFSNVRITLFACCCPSLRWADNLDKAKPDGTPIMRYWLGIAVEAGMYLLCGLFNPFVLIWAPIWIAIGVVCRQKLRMRYNIASHTGKTIAEDIFARACCCLCANVQEARQVEAGRHV